MTIYEQIATRRITPDTTCSHTISSTSGEKIPALHEVNWSHSLVKPSLEKPISAHC